MVGVKTVKQRSGCEVINQLHEITRKVNYIVIMFACNTYQLFKETSVIELVIAKII